MKHKLKCVKHKLKKWLSAYSKSCNPQCGPAQGYGLVGGRRLKSGLFNRYVIVGISEVFGHNHADLQSVTPALAHDSSVNYSTAPLPKRRGSKLKKNSRKGCDRLEKKTFLLLSTRIVDGPTPTLSQPTPLPTPPKPDPSHGIQAGGRQVGVYGARGSTTQHGPGKQC